jgi:hypothetical protein
MMLYSSTVTLPSTFFFVCIASSFFILIASSFFVLIASWRPLGKRCQPFPSVCNLLHLWRLIVPILRRQSIDPSMIVAFLLIRSTTGSGRGRWGAGWIRCKLAAQDQRLQAVNGRIRRIVCLLGGKEQSSDSNLSSSQKKCLTLNGSVASL